MIMHRHTETKVQFDLTDASQLALPYSKAMYQPTSATVTLGTEAGKSIKVQRVLMYGSRIKKDGTVGVAPATGDYRMYRKSAWDELPAYVQEIANTALGIVKGQSS